MDIPELIDQGGTWVGPSTSFKYIVPELNKIILVHNQDYMALKEEYGQEKLPII